MLFCTGAYPAKQQVFKEDGIKYWPAQSVSDEAFKRTQFVVQQMTSHSPEIREKMVATGFTVTLRTDVNGGFNTQQKIKDRDKALVAVLEKVYGSVQLQHSPGCAY